jgi:hypothetical protein
MLNTMPAVAGRRGRPRRRPEKLHADKAYDHKSDPAGHLDQAWPGCGRRSIKEVAADNAHADQRWRLGMTG